MAEEKEQYSFDVFNNPDVGVGFLMSGGYYKFYLLFGASNEAAGTSFAITVRESKLVKLIVFVCLFVLF